MVLGPDARMFLSQACLGAVSLSLYYVDWACWVANKWVPSIFSSGSHTDGISWEILASITMWSPILHLMVALYRGFQILLHSLGTMSMVTQGRGMIHLCAPNIPLCAHIVSKEALVVVLRQLQVRDHLSLLFVVPDSDILPLPGLHAYREKSVQKVLFTKDYAWKENLGLVQIWFSSDLRYF